MTNDYSTLFAPSDCTQPQISMTTKRKLDTTQSTNANTKPIYTIRVRRVFELIVLENIQDTDTIGAVKEKIRQLDRERRDWDTGGIHLWDKTTGRSLEDDTKTLQEYFQYLCIRCDTNGILHFGVNGCVTGTEGMESIQLLLTSSLIMIMFMLPVFSDFVAVFPDYPTNSQYRFSHRDVFLYGWWNMGPYIRWLSVGHLCTVCGLLLEIQRFAADPKVTPTRWLGWFLLVSSIIVTFAVKCLHFDKTSTTNINNGFHSHKGYVAHDGWLCFDDFIHLSYGFNMMTPILYLCCELVNRFICRRRTRPCDERSNLDKL
jgi:hypothetical protein